MYRIRSCEHILRDDTGEGLGRPRQFRPTESVSTEALTGMCLCITDLVVTESDPHGSSPSDLAIYNPFCGIHSFFGEES